MKLKSFRLFESESYDQKKELYWMNQVLSEIKDQFLQTPNDFIKFYDFDIRFVQFRQIEKINGMVTCHVNLFTRVKDEVDRIVDIFKDDGYELKVDVSTTPKGYIGNTQEDSIVGRFYTFTMSPIKEKKLNESIINEDDEIEWIEQVFAEITDVLPGCMDDLPHAPAISTVPFTTNKYRIYLSCSLSESEFVENELDRIKNILEDDGYTLSYYSKNRYTNMVPQNKKDFRRFKINIEKLDKKVNESKDDGDPKEIEWLKQVFSEITDVLPGCMTELEFIPFIVHDNKEILRYETSIECDVKDSEFIEEELERIKEILKDDGYILEFNSRYKYIARHIVNRMPRNIKDFKQYHITIQKVGGHAHKDLFDSWKKTNESTLLESHLLIVDIQKSFHRYFTEKYVHEVKKYAEQFNNVYQLWDNHVDGKDVDKDFLYDKNPDVPVHDDLYHFANQKQLIEKRYNYKVTADYYKKILDRETRKKIKETQLKKGDFFLTKENTIIVFIGNNHRWFHTPKKLYELFKKLKGKDLTIIGGSSGECLLDIEVTARALGVNIKLDHRFIYSAVHCPIK